MIKVINYKDLPRKKKKAAVKAFKALVIAFQKKERSSKLMFVPSRLHEDDFNPLQITELDSDGRMPIIKI